MIKEVFLLTVIVSVLSNLTASCSSVESRTPIGNATLPTSSPTLAPESVVSISEDPQTLCNRLHEVKRIPYSPGQLADDPVYDGLYKQGMAAVPCLVEKITDTTPMSDPGPGPASTPDYRVGDAAVFILLMITKTEWQPETMLSPEYAKRWKSDGIYVYYSYVEKLENRKKLQAWWRSWIKKNLKH